MLQRFGLRFRMTVSYVAVTAAAVLIIEVVLLTLVAPALRSADQRVHKAQSDQAAAKAQATARNDATALGLLLGKLAVGNPKVSDAQLLELAAQHAGPLSLQASPNGIDLEALAGLDGTVTVSSLPTSYPVGSRLPSGWTPNGTGTTSLHGDPAVWVTLPVRVLSVSGAVATRSIAVLYVRVGAGDGSGTAPSSDSSTTERLLLPGLLILGLLVPIGALFGLLTTWQPIRRVQGLAKVITAVANGDLGTRIPVKGGDELGHLEEGFNDMAQQLETAVRRERETAAVEARRVERNRLAQELHDSVSQDLFSINLFVGGLREALPGDSPLHKQVESMEQTIDRTMLEMRALLLELRPIALEGAGLMPALRELCLTYETRLGFEVISEIPSSMAELRFAPKVEHTVLRVVQEAFSNAVRHSGCSKISLRLTEGSGCVNVTVEDDGIGFDPARAEAKRGMGLELMRERVGELSGMITVSGEPGQGTVVHVSIPGDAR